MEKQFIDGTTIVSGRGVRRQARGFTIMEIIVVVVIFAVFAGFAIPGYEKVVRKSRERSANMALTALHAANEFYKIENWQYLPGSLNLTQINSGLGIDIKPQGMTYAYSRTASDEYTATASWTGNTNFTVRVDQRLISLADNPSCSAGTCQLLPTCP